MTFTAVYPIVALATVASFFVFLWIWRAHTIERASGKTPLYLYAILIGGGAAALLFIRVSLHQPILTGWSLLGTVLIGEAMGAIGIYAIHSAFVQSRGLPLQSRVIDFVQMAIILSVFAAPLFY